MSPQPPGRDDGPVIDVPAGQPGLLRRLAGRIGPIGAGMLLDLVDLATFGPLGLYGGFLVAGALGYWIASGFGLSRRMRVLAALLAAVYAATPATEFVPLGTIFGTLARLRRNTD